MGRVNVFGSLAVGFIIAAMVCIFVPGGVAVSQISAILAVAAAILSHHK